MRKRGDDIEARLAEIDENLIRHNLTALEEGEQLIERDELLAARGERAEAGWHSNQYTNLGGADSAPPKTTAIIAAEAGFSERTAQQRKQAARDIVADVKDVGGILTFNTAHFARYAPAPPQGEGIVVVDPQSVSASVPMAPTETL